MTLSPTFDLLVLFLWPCVPSLWPCTLVMTSLYPPCDLLVGLPLWPPCTFIGSPCTFLVTSLWPSFDQSNGCWSLGNHFVHLWPLCYHLWPLGHHLWPLCDHPYFVVASNKWAMTSSQLNFYGFFELVCSTLETSKLDQISTKPSPLCVCGLCSILPTWVSINIFSIFATLLITLLFGFPSWYHFYTETFFFSLLSGAACIQHQILLNIPVESMPRINSF